MVIGTAESSRCQEVTKTSIGVGSMLLAVILWMTRGYNEAGFEQAMANAFDLIYPGETVTTKGDSR